MDCDTTGIEPDFALVKFKKPAGGGYFKIINRSVPPRLRAGLRLGPDRRSSPMPSAMPALATAPASTMPSLIGHGFGPRELEKVDGAGLGLDIQLRLQTSGPGRGLLQVETLGIPGRQAERPDLRPLRILAFTRAQIESGERSRLRLDDAGRRI